MLVEKGATVTLRWVIPAGEVDSLLDPDYIKVRFCFPNGTFRELPVDNVVNSVAQPPQDGYIEVALVPDDVGAYIVYLFNFTNMLGRIGFNSIVPNTFIGVTLDKDEVYP